MKIIANALEMQNIIQRHKSDGKTVGFVPTMGFLHEGHKSLLQEARKHHDIVALSIFVNPLQFGPNEDFDTYPRDMKRDETIASEMGVDIIFYPTVNEMYGDELTVSVKVTNRTDALCGRKRPGHFDGVATVLTKLFNIVLPDEAFFGLKDAQQVAIVQGLVDDFNFPVKIVPVSTVREEDGLAKSSRNVYLLEEERKQAPELYRSLLMAKKSIEEGVIEPSVIVSFIEGHIKETTNGLIDYVEVYSYPQLKPLEQLSGKIIIAIAVKFSKARLIDNIILDV
ncbi:pantoate--beta-alanine ligase [Peribacillus alkalitolerans]|uniref:pantoate--beta-alanine ligase n=1 Tax=Peribacillus alkalitolerans TaxID=1550385 RepID=UPI0013D7CEDB|nr:pantoate--beta-alanine ligase [Peribacillus alkalitolerans]